MTLGMVLILLPKGVGSHSKLHPKADHLPTLPHHVHIDRNRVRPLAVAHMTEVAQAVSLVFSLSRSRGSLMASSLWSGPSSTTLLR